MMNFTFKHLTALVAIVLMASFAFAQQPCNYWYVSPTGSGILGTPDNPTDLQYAIDNADPARNHVRLLGGNYTFASKLLLAGNLILEGGYQVSGSDWVLSSGGATSLNINPTLETMNVSGTEVGYYVGVEAVGLTNFELRNLTLNVQLAGATGTTSDRGNTIYGLYLSGCSNYEISRVEVNTGDASNGVVGDIGAGGIDGGNASNGQLGDCDGCFWPWCSGAGVPGGAGGVGGGGTGAGVDGAGLNGGGGGKGGDGGVEGDNNGQDSQQGGGINGSLANTTGGGGGGNGGDPGGPGSSGFAGADGSNGGNGTTAPNGTVTSGYFIPGAQADAGTDGLAGKGGRGGGGGGGQGCTFCDDGAGNGGGGGGGGASAGGGGTGGTGGGSTYGIFAWANGAGGQLIDANFSSGTAGSGGSGGDGGFGGDGGEAGSGALECTGEVGGGADGGDGGNGGDGGDGADGDSGESVPVFEDGSTITQTGAGIPTTFSPIVVSQFQGCTNSEIGLQKNGGDFDLSAMGNPLLVNNVDPVTSTYITAQNDISVYYSAIGEHDVVVSGTTYNNFVSINSTRTLPSMEVIQDGVSVSALCGSADVELSTTDIGNDYDWAIVHNGVATPATGGNGGSATTHTFGATNGTYYVRLRVKDECCGWSIPVYTELEVAPPVVVDVGPDTTVCPGGALTFDAGNGFADYTWSTTEITQSISVSTTGIYGVTVTDVSGCVGYDEVAVGIAPPLSPLVTASGPTTICAGDTIILSAGPGYTEYLWSDGFTLSEELVVTTSGDFAVNVTSDLGCTGASSIIQVNVNSLPNAVVNPVGEQHICEGDSVTLSALAGYDYDWSGGLGASQSVTINTTGDYSVTITDDNGCENTSAISTVEVHTAEAPTINVDGPLSFCKGGSVVLDAGTGYSSYLWTSGSTTQSITVSESGTYSVTVMDPYGCIDSTLLPDPVMVTVWDPQPILSTVDDTIWVVNAAEFSTFQWFLDGVEVDGATGANLTIQQTGLYTCLVTDENGCVATSQVYDLLCCVGVEELGVVSLLSLQPNPSEGEFVLRLNSNESVDISISVIDIMGQRIVDTEMIERSTSLTKSIDLSQFPDGVYFLNLDVSGQRISRKLVKH
jgi:hypothetical protein